MEKTERLVIVGDSAFAEIAHEYFEVDTAYRVVGFAVEAAFRRRDTLRGLPVVDLEEVERRFAPEGHAAHAAVAYAQLNRLRARLAATMKARGYPLASYVSPRAFVWRDVALGEHCFVFEGNTLQPGVRLGDGVVVWSGNHVGHHSTIADHCFLASQVVVSGFCRIGAMSFLGVNCSVANNVRVGRDNWIAPHVAVMRDTPDGAMFRAPEAEPARVTAPRFFRVGR